MFGLFDSDDDDEAQAPASTSALTPEQKEQVYDSLLERYRRKADPERLRDAEDRANRRNLVSSIGQIVEGLGTARSAARSGKSVDQSFYDNVRKGIAGDLSRARQRQQDELNNLVMEDRLAWQDKERARKEKEWSTADARLQSEQDPNSQESQLAQSLAKKMMPTGDFGGMSAAQLKSSLPYLEKMYNAEQARRARSDSMAAAAAARDDAKQSDREWKEEQVAKANEEKKKTVLAEVEDRRTNIHSALDTLDQMIAEKGTWEAFGSHNQDLDRLVEQVATDMAKLQDPQSVARPSEVEAVKRNLVSSGFSNRNETARDILRNFRKEVDRRANSAYEIRGLADINPRKASNIADKGGAAGSWESEAIAAPEERIVNGVRYRKVNGGWQRAK